MRRVAIAGVLAMEPKVLILDEPAAGLDPRGRERILGMLQELHRHHNHARRQPGAVIHAVADHDDGHAALAVQFLQHSQNALAAARVKWSATAWMTAPGWRRA